MNEEFAVLLFFFGISLTANLGMLIGWVRAIRRVRRLEDHIFQPQPHPGDDRRVDRLEQAIEAMGGQMDQLANGQEFLNRIVAERLERPRSYEAEREVTPH